jgi:methionyl-tRNA formyltransferase
MRIVFMGADAIACPCLETIAASEKDTLAAVVTQPDRPRGRGLHLKACPPRETAERLGVPVLMPADVNSPQSVAELAGLEPELIIVVAYGGILRAELLALPPLGCMNVHFSLLPRYRGAAPVQWALANGDSETGVTTMYLNPRVDAGDIILQDRLPIEPRDTGGSLSSRLAQRGAVLLTRTLDAIRDGTARRVPQDPALATPAPKLRKADGKIDWTRSAREIHNRIRGFNPWPGCYCELPAGSGRRLGILAARVEPGADAEGLEPGQVCGISGDGPLIQTGNGRLCLLRVQPAGKRAMQGAAFLRGHRMGCGERLG